MSSGLYPPQGVSSCGIFLDDKPCVDPAALYEYCQKTNRPVNQWAGKVNSFTLPRGKHYGRGYVLMLWGDLKKIIPYGVNNPTYFNHTLKFISDYAIGVVLAKIGIVRAQAVTGYLPGGASDREDNSLFMVELADERYIAKFSTVDKSYNESSFRVWTESSTDGIIDGEYYKKTLNGGNQWSWQEVVSDLLSMLPGSLASASISGCPSNVTPRNLIFHGVTAWDALNAVLHQLSLVIGRDLAGNWSIVPKFYPQGDGALQNNAARLSIHIPTADVGLGSLVPEKIRVYFPTDYNAFQNLDDQAAVTGQDAYRVKPLTYTDISMAGLGSVYSPGTMMPLHSSMIAMYDENGTLMNGGELELEGQNLAVAWARSQGVGNTTGLHNIYHGFHTFYPGSSVAAVSWYSETQGPKTEVIESPLSYDPSDKLGAIGNVSAERFGEEVFAQPDLTRKHEQTERFLVVELEQFLDCYGATAQATILYGLPSGEFEETDLDPITVRNLTYATYNVGDRVHVLWHWQGKQWIVIGPPKSPFYKGTLAADMCPGSSASLEHWPNNMDCCDLTLEIDYADNPFILAGKKGAAVVIMYDCGIGDYIVLQVTHRIATLPKEFSSSEGCEPEYDGYGYPTGNTIPTGSCSVSYSRLQFSTMYCDEQPGPLTLFEAQPVLVQTSTYQSGLSIYGTFRYVFVLCACTPFPFEMIRGTACSYGSSGSGA